MSQYPQDHICCQSPDSSAKPSSWSSKKSANSSQSSFLAPSPWSALRRWNYCLLPPEPPAWFCVCNRSSAPPKWSDRCSDPLFVLETCFCRVPSLWALACCWLNNCVSTWEKVLGNSPMIHNILRVLLKPLNHNSVDFFLSQDAPFFLRLYIYG